MDTAFLIILGLIGLALAIVLTRFFRLRRELKRQRRLSQELQQYTKHYIKMEFSL